MPADLTPEQIEHNKKRVKIESMEFRGKFLLNQIRAINAIRDRITSEGDIPGENILHPDFSFETNGVFAYIEGNTMIVESESE